MSLDNFGVVDVDPIVTTKDPNRLGLFLSQQLDLIKTLLRKRTPMVLVDNSVKTSPATTAPSILNTVVIPANNFITPDTFLRIDAFLSALDGADTKRFQVKVGSNVLFDSGTFSGTNKSVFMQLYLFAISGTQQQIVALNHINGASLDIQNRSTTLDFTSPVSVDFITTSGIATPALISLKHVSIKYGRT